MTTPRSTPRRNALEKHQDEVIALLLTGSTPGQIMLKYKVVKSTVMKFQRRHADKLAALQAVVAKEVTDYAIASKVNRIATNDMLRTLLLQVREARAKGEMGMETGLVVRREKALGSGQNMTIVEEYEIDPALVTLIDRLQNATSDELGQKPKPDMHIGDKNVFIFEVVPPHGRSDYPQLG